MGSPGPLRETFLAFYRLHEQNVRGCFPADGEAAPAGISRWAGKSVNLQPYLGRSPSVSSEVDILLPLETRHFCAPRFASPKNFLRAAWTPPSQNSDKEKRLESRQKPGKDLSALLFLLCTVWVESFSCSNLTDVTGCVLPNPEVCVSGNRAQMLPADAAPPTACRAQCKALRPNLKVQKY